MLGLVQWFKDLALLLLWCGLKFWLRFDPWPGDFHMLRVWCGVRESSLAESHTIISVYMEMAFIDVCA